MWGPARGLASRRPRLDEAPVPGSPEHLLVELPGRLHHRRQGEVLEHVVPRALADLFARESRLPHGRMLELADIAEALTGREGEASLERLRGMAAGLVR